MTTATDEQIKELEALFAKTAPGPWFEDGYNDKSSGASYRIAQVMCPSGKPERGSVVVCDTLNAHFMFTEDERYHNMEFVVRAHELLPSILIRLREAEQRAEKWFSKACEQQALRLVAEASVASLTCDCGASADGKWGGVHTADCAAVKNGAASFTQDQRSEK